MTFSIKATIRAWLEPDAELSCPSNLWRRIVGELERRGEGNHEAGAFLLGPSRPSGRSVTDVVYYDDLDPKAYSSGVCVLTGDAFARLWEMCRERGVSVVADVHTHPGAGFQSHVDRINPMVARAGHIALILPDYGRWPLAVDRFGIYEYRGDHRWFNRSPAKQPGYFYTGFWS